MLLSIYFHVAPETDIWETASCFFANNSEILRLLLLSFGTEWVQFLYLLATGLMKEVRFLTEPEIILFVTAALEPT